MLEFELSRRKLLRLGFLAGLSGLLGCGIGRPRPQLTSAPETLPKKWRRALPAPWRYKPIEPFSGVNPFAESISNGTDLLALGDGWLSELSQELLQPIGLASFRDRFDFQAVNFLNGLGPEMASRVLPVWVSPWVLVFRNGNEWISRARETWDVLLDQGLKGFVVLPQSPRLIMSIADQIDRPDSLRELRGQAIAADDRYSLNWILEGKARVAVLPLHKCLSILRMDPRLSIALPQTGAPLHWTVLVHTASSKHLVSPELIEAAWEPSMSMHLLANGWIPPLPHKQLHDLMKALPSSYQSIVLPAREVWSRCWSFPRLNDLEKKRLIQRWNISIP